MNIYWGRPLPVVLAISLTACTSYTGYKLPADGSLPDKASGIPYTLTKPEYSVDVTVDSEDPSNAVYTLHRTDVPDSNQRYSIALDPALFTDGSFTVKLGENGNLTETKSVMNSQVVATIKAVATVAINNAKGTLDESLQDKNTRDRYLVFVSNSTDPACKTQVGPGVTAAKQINNTLTTLADTANKEKTKNINDAVINDYLYKSLSEKECLGAVRQTIESTPPGNKPNDRKPLYDAANDGAGKLGSDQPIAIKNAVRLIVAAVPEWVRNNDIASLSRANTYRGRHFQNVPDLEGYMKKAINYVNEKLATNQVKEFAKALDLKPDVWRARTVKNLGKEIEALRLKKDLAPSRAAQTTRLITERERRRADLAGGAALFDRIQKIDVVLQQVRTARGAPGSAADEHIKLREERDKLQEKLQGLIASTVAADSKAKGKITPLENQRVRLANGNFVKEFNAGLSELFEPAPEFVLVLDQKPEDNFSDPPVVKKLTEAKP